MTKLLKNHLPMRFRQPRSHFSMEYSFPPTFEIPVCVLRFWKSSYLIWYSYEHCLTPCFRKNLIVVFINFFNVFIACFHQLFQFIHGMCKSKDTIFPGFSILITGLIWVVFGDPSLELAIIFCHYHRVNNDLSVQRYFFGVFGGLLFISVWYLFFH